MTMETKRPREEENNASNGDAPAAKMHKVDPTLVDAAVIKKQIEYYFSDDNLAGDKMFYEKIKEDKEHGYLPVELIMGCNKIKQMRISKEQISKAIEGSDKVEMKADLSSLRRKDNKELPAFTGIRPGMNKQRQNKFNANLNTHSMGVVLEIKNIPEAVEFGSIKSAIKESMDKSAESDDKKWGKKVQFCSMKKNNLVHISVSPFFDNLKFFKENLTSVTVVEGEGETKKEHKLTVDVLVGKPMESALAGLPQRAKDDLKKAHRNFTHQLAKNKKQIRLANLNFDNVQSIKKKVKEIQAVRGNGEELKVGGSDYNLVLEILKFHPSAPSKMKDMSGLTVDESSYGGTRCFYVLKKDGNKEDFSITKALAALEANPPFLEKDTPKKEEKKEETK